MLQNPNEIIYFRVEVDISSLPTANRIHYQYLAQQSPQPQYHLCFCFRISILQFCTSKKYRCRDILQVNPDCDYFQIRSNDVSGFRFRPYPSIAKWGMKMALPDRPSKTRKISDVGMFLRFYYLESAVQ